MSKTSLSIPEQIGLLERRGLQHNGNELARALMTNGYFRLSGYWRYFQSDPSAGRNVFAHGTEFSAILDLYLLDADLRNLLLEGMSEVEVALRASLTAALCRSGGAGTEYLDPATYRDLTDRAGASIRDRLLDDIRNDVRRSKERHVVHHRHRGIEAVPMWVATEALSFGTMSRIYGLLDIEPARLSIAARFGYTGGLASSFSSNIRAVAVFRNVCAHHSRVWNRVVHHDKPRVFSGAFGSGMYSRMHAETPWGVICVLAHLVKNVRQNDTFMQALEALARVDDAYWNGLVRPDPR